MLDLTERRLRRADGRTVAWAEWGPSDAQPVLRIPGTPGSRIPSRTDTTPWVERNLRLIMTERPGFGASSPMPGHGFVDHAHDLAAILDEVGIARLPVMGGSGGAPYILALAATYPERVSAATILVGAAPLDDAEIDGMIDINRTVHRLRQAGQLEELDALLTQYREALVADPLAGVRTVMAEAPQEDQDILNDPAYQEGLALSVTDALRQGIEGWSDEGAAVHDRWDEIDPAAIACSITWWHAADDRNAPLSAAQRLVEQLPDARLHVWPQGGHLLTYHHEGEILDDLLARHQADSASHE